jgi:hypothetical protein
VRSWRAVLLAAGLAAVVGTGCLTPFGTNDAFDPSTLPNARPVARVSVTNDSLLAPTSYNRATFHWSGTDEDGFVVGFHVAIALDEVSPPTWIFTSAHDSTATYNTDANGQAAPVLYVVAEDDKGALSDTVSTRFPLVNFPPSLEFPRNFEPLAQSFGAASFEFLGFDRDGDETLEPFIDYRFAGSDSNLVQPEDAPGADPALGWVRSDLAPTRFSLLLRGIPEGDPASDYEQTLYVRILDEAGAGTTLAYTWQNFEARGEVLLVDDNANPSQASRDHFYQDALSAHLGAEYSTWDIETGLPDRAEDLWLTLSQFRVIVWYTSTGTSANLQQAQASLQRFIQTDLDEATPGDQYGRLLLEYQSAVGSRSNLSSTFRSQVLGIGNTTDPRNPLATYSGSVKSDLGPLDILSEDATLPDLVSVGLNYDGGSGVYFGLVGLSPNADAAPLWRFEEYRWGGPSDPTCRLGCSPVVAVRWPGVGPARSVLLGFQLGYANAGGNAIETLQTILSDYLGVPSLTGGTP